MSSVQLGVSQLPACSTWQSPACPPFCFTSQGFRKASGCLIIVESCVREQENRPEPSQACAATPSKAALVGTGSRSFLDALPGMKHRPLSSCLVYVAYAEEFLRFFSWQHLETNVRNQKQICFFLCWDKCIFQVCSHLLWKVPSPPPPLCLTQPHCDGLKLTFLLTCLLLSAGILGEY